MHNSEHSRDTFGHQGEKNLCENDVSTAIIINNNGQDKAMHIEDHFKAQLCHCSEILEIITASSVQFIIGNVCILKSCVISMFTQ